MDRLAPSLVWLAETIRLISHGRGIRAPCPGLKQLSFAEVLRAWATSHWWLHPRSAFGNRSQSSVLQVAPCGARRGPAPTYWRDVGLGLAMSRCSSHAVWQNTAL